MFNLIIQSADGDVRQCLAPRRGGKGNAARRVVDLEADGAVRADAAAEPHARAAEPQPRAARVRGAAVSAAAAAAEEHVVKGAARLPRLCVLRLGARGDADGRIAEEAEEMERYLLPQDDARCRGRSSRSA